MGGVCTVLEIVCMTSFTTLQQSSHTPGAAGACACG